MTIFGAATFSVAERLCWNDGLQRKGLSRSVKSRWNRKQQHPHHAIVRANLDPELHRLALGIPAGVLGEGRLGKGTRRAILVTEWV